MKSTIGALLLVIMFSGCDSSKPAPKPFKWDSNGDSASVQKKIDQPQKQNPCSAENLKNATAEQRNKCDPTRSMMESVNPKTAPPKK